MATTGRTAATDEDDAALAASLREASVVHLVSHADGDALAAAGLLARALPDDTAYQVSTARTRAAADRRLASSTATTVALGFATETADVHLDGASVSYAAYDVASELDTADPSLALAGGIAAGVLSQGAALDAAHDEGLTRRPGVGIPTADLGDGLAHSTLYYARVSGDEQQAGALLAELALPAELDDTAHQRVASALAMEVTAPPAPASAVPALERALRPHVLPNGPVETVEGFADVLESLARSAPGLGAAFAVGRLDRTDALSVWREHASTVHDAVRLGDRNRSSGLVVLEADDADPWTVARLVRDFRSAEPAALVVGTDEVALATTETNALDRLDAVDAIESVGGRDDLASGPTDAPTAEIRSSLEVSR
jgi:hypothetical protein